MENYLFNVFLQKGEKRKGLKENLIKEKQCKEFKSDDTSFNNPGDHLEDYDRLDFLYFQEIWLVLNFILLIFSFDSFPKSKIICCWKKKESLWEYKQNYLEKKQSNSDWIFHIHSYKKKLNLQTFKLYKSAFHQNTMLTVVKISF